jgi:hypothetical protein
VPAATLTKVPAASVNVIPGAAEASVTLIRNAAPTLGGHSVLRVVGSRDMSDDELADDAESSGYSLFAAGGNSDHSTLGKPYTGTGIVRRTDDGFSLETSKGLFKKTKGAMILVGSDDILAKLGDRENKKAQIKGTEDLKTHVVTVTSVKGLADMGFLVNWLSRGKIVGTVVEKGTGTKLSDVKVECKSADGFKFEDMSDADGKFEIKNLTPGDYTLKFSKSGGDWESFTTATPVSLAKRQSLTLNMELDHTTAQP